VFISWPVVIIGVFLFAFAGIAIGALAGWLASLLIRSGPQGVLKNAVLGLFGIFAGFMLVVLFQGRHYHAEYYFENGKAVTRHSGGQYPELFGVAGAMLLPVLHELYRAKRARS
jgi:uncharacterized membrane protein YeaQ/YmgE (transglycosylase-associated protein family)